MFSIDYKEGKIQDDHKVQVMAMAVDDWNRIRVNISEARKEK